MGTRLATMETGLGLVPRRPRPYRMKALVVFSGTAAVSFYSVDNEFEKYLHERLEVTTVSSVSTKYKLTRSSDSLS